MRQVIIFLFVSAGVMAQPYRTTYNGTSVLSGSNRAYIAETSIPVADKLYEYYNGASDHHSNLDSTADLRGISFLVGAEGELKDFQISRVRLKMYRIGTPGNLSVKIREIDASNNPSTILATATITTSGFTTDTVGDWYTATFSDHPRLYKDTLYYLQASLLTNTGDTVCWRSVDWSGYDGGQNISSNDSGSNWSFSGDRDYLFEIYGVPRGDETILTTNDPPVNPPNDSAGWDDFTLYLYSDFNDNTLGYYKDNIDEYEEDWPGATKVWNVYQEEYRSIVDTTLGGRKRERVHQAEAVVGGDTYLWMEYVPIGDTLEEAYLSFSVMFTNSFDPDKGGKIMGMFGEPKADGGSSLDWDDGFSASIMFKGSPSDMYLAHYPYYWPHNEYEYEYGDFTAWDSVFATTTDKWLDVTYRIVMNDRTATSCCSPDGTENAILEGFMGNLLVAPSDLTDGGTDFLLANLTYRGITHLKSQCFFGGGGSVPQKHEIVLLDNVIVWKYSDTYLSNNSGVPRGNETWDQDTIYTPFHLLYPSEY